MKNGWRHKNEESLMRWNLAEVRHFVDSPKNVCLKTCALKGKLPI